MSETTWFITGASSGLGYALAEHVLQKGARVVMGARTVAPMNEPPDGPDVTTRTKR